MVREIPEAVRAAAGLVATVLDEARKLPETLPGLPVRLLGLAMQSSLRLQQQYSGLVARGDEVFTGLLGNSEPGMATFDEDLPEPTAPGDRPSPRSSAFDRVVDLAEDPADDLTVELSDEIVVLGDDSGDDIGDVVDEASVYGLAGDPPVSLDDALGDTVSDPRDEVPGDLAADLVGNVADEADVAPLADVLALDTLAAEDGAGISDAEVALLPTDPLADAVTGTVDELADEVDAELAVKLPESVPDEVADDLAADAVATGADEEIATDATSTAAAPAEGGISDEPAGGSDVAGSQAAGTAPVEGYDGFSIPTLRGRLRTFDAERVNELLDYERATRSRAPYVTLLSNRLAKLTAPTG